MPRDEFISALETYVRSAHVHIKAANVNVSVITPKSDLQDLQTLKITHLQYWQSLEYPTGIPDEATEKEWKVEHSAACTKSWEESFAKIDHIKDSGLVQLKGLTNSPKPWEANKLDKRNDGTSNENL